MALWLNQRANKFVKGCIDNVVADLMQEETKLDVQLDPDVLPLMHNIMESFLEELIHEAAVTAELDKHDSVTQPDIQEAVFHTSCSFLRQMDIPSSHIIAEKAHVTSNPHLQTTVNGHFVSKVEPSYSLERKGAATRKRRKQTGRSK